MSQEWAQFVVGVGQILALLVASFILVIALDRFIGGDV
jgi:hypothetical protein